MASEQDVVARVQHLTVSRLRVWVAQGLIKPDDEATPSFSEADVARARIAQGAGRSLCPGAEPFRRRRHGA